MEIKNKKVLVIAAHTDDEILGLAGTIKQLTSNGNQVLPCILSESATSRTQGKAAKTKNQILFDSAGKAAELLNCKAPLFGNFPDNCFDKIPLLEIVQFLENIKNEFDPDIVFKHNESDLNIDHQYSGRAARTAFRVLPSQKPVTIISFETPSSTEWLGSGDSFHPNWYVNISTSWPIKEEALKIYSEELHDFPHARSIKAIKNLAIRRGIESGQKMAEAFFIERIIG